MFLPSIKLNVNPKTIVIAASIVGAAGTFVSIGYLLGSDPVEVVCKQYIQEGRMYSKQLKSLELAAAKAKDTYTLQCVEREKEICTELVKKTTENIKKLRCRICKAQGVR
jgi:hypothetical protein